MSAKLPVRNPRTGRYDYFITPAGSEQIAAAARRLRAGQRAWLDAGVDPRIEALQALKAAVTEQREPLRQALEADTGRRWVSAVEIDSVISGIDRACAYAAELLAEEPPRATGEPELLLGSAPVPYPLVAVISPWNFPLQLALIDAVPALLAGAAVLIKPSEVTPRFIPVLRRCIASVPPVTGAALADVVEVLEGAGATGAGLVDVADAVCFTGSVRTGRAVARAAAERFIPAFLELGGKDPAIVTQTANLDAATSAILWGATINTGHSCMSIERVYVAEPVYESFVDQLVTKAEQVTLAYPTPADGQIGPIIAHSQIGVLTDHLTDAVSKCATVHTGGTIEVLDGGSYLRPTVLTKVNHTMRVMIEETFGPIVPVMPYTTAQQAVELANDTSYGLSAAVFAGSTDEALAIARRLDAGGISINDTCLTGLHPVGEKNSFKLSGLGASRMGPTSVLRFLRKRALLIRDEARIRPWYYDGGTGEPALPTRPPERRP